MRCTLAPPVTTGAEAGAASRLPAQGPWGQERVGTAFTGVDRDGEVSVHFECRDAAQVVLEVTVGERKPERAQVVCGQPLEKTVKVRKGEDVGVSAHGDPGPRGEYAIGFTFDRHS